jgi:hypothetical protein
MIKKKNRMKTMEIVETKSIFVVGLSGGELLEMRLLDTFGSKSIARHKFYQLLESS